MLSRSVSGFTCYRFIVSLFLGSSEYFFNVIERFDRVDRYPLKLIALIYGNNFSINDAIRFNQFLSDLTGFYRVLPSFSGHYLVSISFTEFYRVFPSFIVFYPVLPSFT